MYCTHPVHVSTRYLLQGINHLLSYGYSLGLILQGYQGSFDLPPCKDFTKHSAGSYPPDVLVVKVLLVDGVQ